MRDALALPDPETLHRTRQLWVVRSYFVKLAMLGAVVTAFLNGIVGMLAGGIAGLGPAQATPIALTFSLVPMLPLWLGVRYLRRFDRVVQAAACTLLDLPPRWAVPLRLPLVGAMVVFALATFEVIDRPIWTCLAILAIAILTLGIHKEAHRTLPTWAAFWTVGWILLAIPLFLALTPSTSPLAPTLAAGLWILLAPAAVPRPEHSTRCQPNGRNRVDLPAPGGLHAFRRRPLWTGESRVCLAGPKTRGARSR